MRVEIFPGKLCGRIKAPYSKSVLHRMLIGSALSLGESTIYGITLSDDILATIDCLRNLGVEITFDDEKVNVTGVSTDLFENKSVIDCRESASTLRFLIPLCLLNGKEYVFSGNGRLMKRPLDVYEKICTEHGFKFDLVDDKLHICGKLNSGTYEIKGDVSSQFVTGLMYALSLLKESSIIKLIPPVESRSYIDLSMAVLNDFGCDVKYISENEIALSGNSVFDPKEHDSEGDYSNAAFFDALNYMGSEVKLENLAENSYQGDKIYKKYFPLIKKNHPTIDLSDCPDLGPILFALSAYKGGGRFSGVARLRLKESDRIKAMKEELNKFEVDIVECGENEVEIVSNGLKPPKETLFSHNDHRIAMALGVLCSITGGVIEDAQCVNKSFPEFWERFGEVGGKIIIFN